MRYILGLAAALLAASPLAAQQRIERAGPIAHESARAVFPERVGALRRTGVVSYRPDSSDMSASYETANAGGRLLITVYIYPAGRVEVAPGTEEAGLLARALLCQREFDQTTGAIRQTQSSASLVESGSAPAAGGVEPPLALRAVYRMRTQFYNQLQDVRSEARLYCYAGGDWLVKYRATSNTAFAAEEAIEAFIAQGPWPGRATAETDPVAP